MNPTPVTDRAAFRAAASDAAGARVPVVATLRSDPFDAYRRARGDDPAFFFETSGGPEGWGYFGVAPDAFYESSEAFDTLETVLDGEGLVRGDCEIPYPGGLFGWLSYDAVRELEDLPDAAARERELPRVQVGRYPTVAAWREPHDGETELRLVSAPRVENADDADDAYDRALADIDALAERIETGDPEHGDPPASAESVPFASDCGRAAFADRVRTVKEYIREGDTFQANVSQRLVAPAAVHPVAAYDALREMNPAPYSGLVEFPGVDLVSASPELLLETDGERIETEPIAGTRPRGENEGEDRELAADLTGNEKERAEHAMLVDLERNDIGKVSVYGSVDVAEYRRVDRYSEVMHLVSLVTGDVREGATLADAVAAMFPGGTITGAPKPRTMEIIDEVEKTRRGPYTGSMAAIGFDGAATLNIVIRTLVRYGDEYGLRVGAGIVHDSVPEREYEETLDKARALVNAVDEALGTEMGIER